MVSTEDMRERIREKFNIIKKNPRCFDVYTRILIIYYICDSD